MKKEYSIYLDLVRFSAAMLVFLHHLDRKDIVPSGQAILSGHGHTAVMLFFVLSGYVIAYVTDTREKAFATYAANRCSRIYSVALPAVLLTPLLDMVGRYMAPDLYAGSAPFDLWGVRILSSLLFTNEMWFFSIMSFSNLPYWSLNYEVWYYALFAAVHFLDGRRRIITCAVIMLLMGPKMLLLAPVWWIGVWAYRNQWGQKMSEASGWLLFTGSLVLMSLFLHFELEENLRQWLRDTIGIERTKLLVSSQFFLSHYLLAIIVVMNFLGMRAIAHRFGWLLLRAERPIRFTANYTFTLYLFHLPLIWFFAALFQDELTGMAYYYAIMASVLVAVWLIGHITEDGKEAYRGVFNRLFARLPRPPRQGT